MIKLTQTIIGCDAPGCLGRAIVAGAGESIDLAELSRLGWTVTVRTGEAQKHWCLPHRDVGRREGGTS